MSKNKLTPEKKLDTVLTYLNNDEEYQETHQQISERINLQLSDKELHLILEKLLKDDYVSYSFVKSGGKPTEQRTFYISFEGRLFLRRGGFQKESRTLKRKYNWTLAKTIAAILNAISILAIGVIGIFVSRDSKQKDEKIFKLEKTLDSLQDKKQPLATFSDTTSIKFDTSKQNRKANAQQAHWQ